MVTDLNGHSHIYRYPIRSHFSACSFCRFHFESTRTQGFTDSRQQHKNMGSKAHHNSTRVFGMPPTTRILNLEIKARAAIPLPRKDSLNLVLAKNQRRTNKSYLPQRKSKNSLGVTNVILMPLFTVNNSNIYSSLFNM